jgi:hypothetical protein
MMQSSASLLEQVITAHGGLERWQRAGELAVQHSSGGFAFIAKFQGRTLSPHLARVSTDLQRTVLTPYPGPGRRGVFERGAVRIETDGGRLLAQRRNPRSDLRSLRRRL